MITLSPSSSEQVSAHPSSPQPVRKSWVKNGLAVVLLVAFALLLGTYDLSGSGPLWPDAPRYANAGAMIHDWLVSGDLLHPYAFAVKNYARYPAFNIPFHPPAYPGALGLFFAAAGVSYEAARTFVALCLGVSACFFFALLRRHGVSWAGAVGCSLLLLTTPELVCWSRDTMSEIPALMFILAGTYFFLLWLESGRPAHCWLAFGFAELAFLSRLLTAGVLVAWLLFTLLSGRRRRLHSPHLIAAAMLYLGLGLAYVRWVTPYARYEASQHQVAGPLSWVSNLSFFLACWPVLVSLGVLAGALSGAVYAVRLRKSYPLGLYWLSLILGYCGFRLALLSSSESRMLLFALPALPGLVACLFVPGITGSRWRWLAPGLVVLGLVTNLVQVWHLPRGMVGYDAVARCLVRQDRPGNVLLACWDEQDLIFHYRARRPTQERQMVRGDRTLAVRSWSAGVLAPEQTARSREDVLDVIHRSRSRYLVTCCPADPRHSTVSSTEEMGLAHRVAQSSAQLFALVEEFPLRIQYVRGEYRLRETLALLANHPLTLANPEGFHGRVFVWEFLGELPEGPSELPVLIPTADMKVPPP